jgi:hypothetical protein
MTDPTGSTAEGDEVEIAASLEALQTVAHEKVWGNAKSKPGKRKEEDQKKNRRAHPLPKPQRVGHPPNRRQ